MTYTESQKREALAWAEGPGLEDDSEWTPGYCEKQGKVLAHFLRLAESELSALRAEMEAWSIRAAADIAALNERLKKEQILYAESAGRAEAAEARLETFKAVVGPALERGEAAEAKVAKMEQRWRQSCGDDFVDRALASLRETEGGAK